MRRALTSVLTVLLVACAGSPSPKQPATPPVLHDVARLVNPFVGTGGHGHTFPGATLPFGMVQLSPDTRLTGWDGCSGYHDSDRAIYGFSHTHLSGTGVSDYGDVLLMPGLGEPGFEQTGYRSMFRKATEKASPGYYGVRLDKHGIDVDLTCTKRVGLHRYRFPESVRQGTVPYVLLDLVHRDPVTRASLRLRSNTEIEGERWSRAWAQDQRVFFVARFSRPFQSCVIEHAPGKRIAGKVGQHQQGKHLKAAFGFGSEQEILVKVGLSATSIEGARKNLEAELGGSDFDFARVRKQAHDTWNATLSRILVEGNDEATQRTFYTALYHCCVAPNLFSDVDGTYRGLDGKVHASRGHDIYTVFSLWDTFRAAHPLFVLLEPERTKDFLRTFLAQYEDGGRLPVWELAGNETNCMIGYHSVPVIVDAWVKGLRDGYDIDKLYAACRHFAMLDQRGQDAYKEMGYISSDRASESVSKTLEYAYDDWCIAQLASALGRTKDEDHFLRRSQAWRHLFDPETGFLRPKRNQSFKTPFDPRTVDNNFTEANAWQYTFFVPHDIAGLMAELGGAEKFAKRLDEMFEAPTKTMGRRQADITGLIGQYAHGNEPSHHMAWLYNHAGLPWKTQARVRQILTTLYSDQPDGLCGNEDCGQMSAWYVFAAMGFYPVCPGTDRYELAAPLFDRVRLRLPNGKEFVIEGRSAASNRYVHSCRLNGQSWTKGYLPHAALVAGGRLRFELGPLPNRTWATKPTERPRTEVARRIVAVPYVVPRSRTFFKSAKVELRAPDSKAHIHYTLDGSEPTVMSPVYRGPITISKSTALRARCVREGRLKSPVVTARFDVIQNDWTVKLRWRPSRLYPGGGPRGLVDGLRGTEDWRTGSWQGYQTDFDAILDLKKRRPVRRIGARFLQDIGSWIWMPQQIEISVSDDGQKFRKLQQLGAGVGIKDYDTQIKSYEVRPKTTHARYVRVQGKNFGKIPAWHLGAGGRAWIFIDEITIE